MRKSLTKPVRKDNLQASTLNQRFDSKFQELRNTVTSEADCVNGRNMAEHQLRVRVDLDFLAALLESPFAGAPGFRVPKINQTMIAFLNASLDDNAKDADVGAGTLYRHFPTRDALIEAVYGTEVEKLAAAERKFTEAMPPIEAFARLDVVIRRLHRDQADHRPSTRRRPFEAVRRFPRSDPGSDRWVGEARNQERRLTQGSRPIRSTSGAHRRLQRGVQPDWQQSAQRLVDILITDSRPVK
jgi:AcrR family transcriptional regulator